MAVISSHSLATFSLLVIDLDGTLVDSEPIHLESYALVISADGHRDVVVDAKDVIGYKEPEIWATLARHYDFTVDATHLQARRQQALINLMAASPPPREPGVWELMDRFRGSRVLLTSQSPDMAQTLLRSLDAADWFDEVISTQRDGTTKLSEMKMLLERRNVSARDVLWVEDASPEIPEIKQLGVSVAVVRRPYNARYQRFADWIID